MLCNPMKALLNQGCLNQRYLHEQWWSTACDWLKGLLWDMAIVTLLQRELISGCITDCKGGCNKLLCSDGHLGRSR